jgi:hypothetical protein
MRRENRPLVRVVEHAVRRESGGADNVLACGHRVTFDGTRPYAQRCTGCAARYRQEGLPFTGVLHEGDGAARLV